MQTNTELKSIMLRHKMARGAVAELTGRSVNTVASWLRQPTCPGYRNMPAHALELLKTKMAAKQ